MTTSRLRLADAIRMAVSDADPVLAGQVCDQLRFRHGLNYDEIQRLVEELTGFEPHEWEALMYEADMLGTRPKKS